MGKLDDMAAGQAGLGAAVSALVDVVAELGGPDKDMAQPKISLAQWDKTSSTW